MVGRTAELGRLRALQGTSSVPVVALIAGEAGIGKTRLVQELVASAPVGTLVLAGQADPGTVGRPMELFLDVLGRADVSSHPESACRGPGPGPIVRGAGAGWRRPRPSPRRRWPRARRVRRPALGRLGEPGHLRAPRRARGRTTGGGRHLPPRRPLAKAPRRRPAAEARPAPLGDAPPAHPVQPVRREHVPDGGVRAGSVVPGRRRTPHPHRRQPVLPRGAGGQRQRPRRRRLGGRTPAVDRRGRRAQPGRRARPGGAERRGGRIGARTPGAVRSARLGDRSVGGRPDRPPPSRRGRWPARRDRC